ncbi:MAG TPA: SDR family NAD(P)-dependent oxidoreductase [Chitinophagaceae bacterium]|jgi:NAD(P)-dependent dehydrogenase (short-subunit alcohol dehydrogenase family)|nr:SDR family NAD(P)-dependent oxidoreductase [Chitinophagaceae bacterium]
MKSALITGAAGNLGQAVVEKFIKEGYHVTGTVHEETSNTKYDAVKVDLSDEKAAQQLVDKVIAKNKTIDVAVLTVGGFAMGKIADTTASDILHQYKLNFETAYHVARPVFVQMMKQGSGRIFLIGSRPGSDMHNSKGMVAYGMAKSLLFRLAELMNDEAKGHNVVTSVVVPSTIDTPPNRKSMPDADFSKWVKPEAIADVIYFYSSEEASALREPVIKVYNNA